VRKNSEGFCATITDEICRLVLDENDSQDSPDASEKTSLNSNPDKINRLLSYVNTSLLQRI